MKKLCYLLLFVMFLPIIAFADVGYTYDITDPTPFDSDFFYSKLYYVDGKIALLSGIHEYVNDGYYSMDLTDTIYEGLYSTDDLQLIETIDSGSSFKRWYNYSTEDYELYECYSWDCHIVSNLDTPLGASIINGPNFVLLPYIIPSDKCKIEVDYYNYTCYDVHFPFYDKNLNLIKDELIDSLYYPVDYDLSSKLLNYFYTDGYYITLPYFDQNELANGDSYLLRRDYRFDKELNVIDSSEFLFTDYEYEYGSVFFKEGKYYFVNTDRIVVCSYGSDKCNDVELDYDYGDLDTDYLYYTDIVETEFGFISVGYYRKSNHIQGIAVMYDQDGKVFGYKLVSNENTDVSIDSIVFDGEDYVIKYAIGDVRNEYYIHESSLLLAHLKIVKYNIFTETDNNGTINYQRHIKNDTEVVEFEIIPEDGYVLKQVFVTDASGNTVAFDKNKFEMPNADVTIKAVFEKQTIINTIVNPDTGTGVKLIALFIIFGMFLSIFGLLNNKFKWVK